MVSERILAKMRLSAGSAGLVLLLSGCGAAEPALPPSAPTPAQSVSATPPAKAPATVTPSTTAKPATAQTTPPIPNQIQTTKPPQCVDACPACGRG